MDIFERDYRIAYSDTDLKQRLRLSRLFTLLQEAATDHAALLGAGSDKTLDRGLLWIVTLQQAKIARLPEYDEQIRLRSWPGKMMHLLFPRYYRIEDRQGNPLVEASALWALMDQSTRRVVFPEMYGVKIRGVHTGKEIPLPTAPKMPKSTEIGTFTVPYSYVDLNGHMNNTRYFDLAEDLMPDALHARALTGVQTEYAKEAPRGAKLLLNSELRGDEYLLCGESDGQRLFRLGLTFAPIEQ
jgi:acyl-ACP thioesterase